MALPRKQQPQQAVERSETAGPSFAQPVNHPADASRRVSLSTQATESVLRQQNLQVGPLIPHRPCHRFLMQDHAEFLQDLPHAAFGLTLGSPSQKIAVNLPDTRIVCLGC